MIPYNVKKDLETNYYDKTEVELLIASAGAGGTIDLSNYYKKLETYSKAQVDVMISSGTTDLSDYYTRAQVDGLLDNISLDDYYTKTQTDSLVDAKQDTLVSATNIKTINGTTLLGSGNIVITGGSGDSVWGAITGTLADQTDLSSALAGKSATTHNHNLADLTEKSYNSLTDKPTIPEVPTAVSAFTNDAEYVVQSNFNDAQNTFQGYIDTINQKSIDMVEPNGFIRDRVSTMGILELCTDGTTVYKIDQNSTLTTRTDGKFATGTAFEVAATARTFAIYPADGSPTFSVYANSQLFEIGELQTATIPNVSGLTFVRMGLTGTIEVGQVFSFDYFEDTPIISLVYSNVTSNELVLFADERHGIQMDGMTHRYLHYTQGAKYNSGMSILGLVENTATFSGVSSGTAYDEDIYMSVPTQTTLPSMYIDGTAWRMTAADNKVGLLVSNVAQANTSTLGNYTLTPLQGTECSLVFMMFTNNKLYPFTKIIGQEIYATLADAQVDITNAPSKTLFSGMPTPEFFPIGVAIVNAAGQMQKLIDGSDYLDLRSVKIGSNIAISGSATYHDELLNVQGGTLGEQYHLTAAQSSGLDILIANISGVNTGDQDLSGYSLMSHNHSLADLTEKSYDSLTDKPTIPVVPTAVSAFTNDSGYITNVYHDNTKSDTTHNHTLASLSEKSYNSLTDKPTQVVVDTTLADGSANAISNNAVFDALGGKQAILVSGTSIKTINSTSLLGSGDIAINGVTNLTSTHNASTVAINSDTGTDATINAATTSLAGVMSSSDKTKLDGLSNYTHPANHSPSIITQDASNRFVTDTEKTTWNGKITANTTITAGTATKITYDAKGLVTAGTSLVEADIPTLSIAKTNGLQTALNGKIDDSQVLTNVPVGALFTDTVYTHPTTDGNKHLPSGGASGQYVKWSLAGTGAWSNLSGDDIVWTTAATAGKFDTSTTTPTATNRINFGGYIYPTSINLTGSADSASAASHYFFESASDGFVRPKTLANVRTEINPRFFTSGVGTAGITGATDYAMFPAAQDTITLAIGTYRVRIVFYCTIATSTVSAQLQFNLRGAGTAVGTCSGICIGTIANGGPSVTHFNGGTALGAVINATAPSAVAGRAYATSWEGIMNVTTAGTIIPAYRLSATATSGVTTLNGGNHMIIERMADTSVTTAGGWA